MTSKWTSRAAVAQVTGGPVSYNADAAVRAGVGSQGSRCRRAETSAAQTFKERL